MIWMQSLNGKAIDLVNPKAADIDFREIADTLANINRYSGGSRPTVSVALHTLIAASVAPAWAVPFVLLHDAHEAYIGDITTPCARALAQIVDEMGERGASVTDALFFLKERHDFVIWQAAGLHAQKLSPPQSATDFIRAIRRADLVALATERRDFLAPSPMPWAAEYEEVPPAKRVWKWAQPDRIADRLYAEFQRHLPVFNGPSLQHPVERTSNVRSETAIPERNQ